ncbi:MAG: DUF655 domain-containing protein [Calothrix sp. MO_167.B42]|nr:DUF655 domain-containing protein [Calothrix sp. MO_167.B42]
MNLSSISLVAVKKINCSSPRSQFTDEDIEEAAKLILASEGVINPIVVRRTSLKSYEVVNGAFEYYAAARAREIDPKTGEMIGVFILEEDNEELLTQQIKAFRNKGSTHVKNSGITPDILNNFIKSLESRLDKITNQLTETTKAQVKLEYEVRDLRKQVSSKQILELFNSLDVNQMTLKLKSAGINQGNASKIADAIVAERNKNKFDSLNHLVSRVKVKRGKKLIAAISEKKMLDIVDSWLNDS